MPHQVALTIITRIKPGATESLKQLLKAMSENAGSNDFIPFDKLTTTHFARLLVLNESIDLDGAVIPASLLFISECDGTLDGYLHELVDIAGAGLDRIYSHCQDYPSGSEITREKRLAYLRSAMVDAKAFYVNTIGRTVQQIRQEAQLRNAIQGFLDRSRQDWPSRTPLEVRAAILAFVAGEQKLSWARKPPPRPELSFRFKERLHMLGVPLLLLILSPLIILALPVWLVLLRRHELSDAAPHLKPDQAHIQELAALEDHVVQNQFSAIGYVKPGWFRRLTVIGVLWLINYSVRHVFNKANLAGVKTIHLARWVATNEMRRVIFTSNYDGSLESYMDDFIDKLAWGLNAAFSNGVGYPKTNWLVLNGAKDEQAFKDYLRIHQLPTQVWYSAYDQLTALDIENNARMRAGLYGTMSETEAQEWLRLL
jgi:hypothetical protein